MAGFCEGGNEPPGSLKAISLPKYDGVANQALISVHASCPICALNRAVGSTYSLFVPLEFSTFRPKSATDGQHSIDVIAKMMVSPKSTVMEFLYDLPLIKRTRMWLQQDVVTAHYALTVRQKLNEMFGVHWIGRGGPQCWPPQSPDLTRLDLFLTLVGLVGIVGIALATAGSIPGQVDDI
ncbi:hypothetical protein ANN_04765 [Periplaneta americana]|uniref:Uncharacterized protein n=1 Tax=Periplaneta americana TaxID=6978 RepID=A0ABQ8TBQ9_PERAM|nr:hypothetical protein ANN_04765 [Periplaneta americana]